MGVSNTIQQLSVFLENREGRLDDVLKVLAQKDVNIVALSLGYFRLWNVAYDRFRPSQGPCSA